MNEKNNCTLTEEQKAFLKENFGKMNEKELFRKFSELGPEADEKAFAEAVSAVASEIESGVFAQRVTEEELLAASGGKAACGQPFKDVPIQPDCTGNEARRIYGGNGFPNCAATVEDGSWCGSSDACYKYQVRYSEMKSCVRAWR